MNSKQDVYDLAVAYRVCSRVSSHAAPVFPLDKFALTNMCLRSFKAALGNLRVKMFVILDSCPVEYDTLFLNLWSVDDLQFIRLDSAGNRASFAQQMKTLYHQTYSYMVFAAEDDYFYLPNSIPAMLHMFNTFPDVDFISPYDCPDHYTTELHSYPREIRSVAGCGWRTAPCSPCTFMTTVSILRETFNVFWSYSQGNTDVGMWLGLTKQHVFNPFKILRWILAHGYWGASAVFAWYFNLRQILFGKKYKLWIPVPSLATHMVCGLLAPVIEWEKAWKEVA